MSSTQSPSGFTITALSTAEIAARSAALSSEEAAVILSKGTERPFCGGLLANKESGNYVCKLCGLPLFRSADKFESGTGWPSFHSVFDPTHIKEIVDASHGMLRTEIVCIRCTAHLGHVFEDGPAPSGKRYCLNSIAMRFEPDKK